jgi:hypothetical protein
MRGFVSRSERAAIPLSKDVVEEDDDDCGCAIIPTCAAPVRIPRLIFSPSFIYNQLIIFKFIIKTH